MFFQDIYTVFWREWIVLNRRMAKFILSRMVTPILYIFALGLGLGKSISFDGGSYLNFIIPGIIALNSMNISFNSVGTPLNMAKLYHKTFEEYLTAPISSWAFVLGKVLAGSLRGLLSSLIIIALGYTFGAQLQIGLGFVLVLSLNCLVFSALAVTAAMSMSSHEDMANFSTYVLVPMSFLCGTFFKADSLPVVLKYFVNLLPLTPASVSLRALSQGRVVDLAQIALMIGYFVVFIVMANKLVNKATNE